MKTLNLKNFDKDQIVIYLEWKCSSLQTCSPDFCRLENLVF